MDIVEIRERLHYMVDTLEEKKALAMYTLFEDNASTDEVEDYTDEFKAELDRRYAEYENDGKVISRREMDEQIKSLLGK